jgi:hypothetical protein
MASNSLWKSFKAMPQRDGLEALAYLVERVSETDKP